MLEYFRQKLLNWRSELLRESGETLNHLQSESLAEPDLTDRATLETDRSLELRTRDRERKLISKIDSALSELITEPTGTARKPTSRFPCVVWKPGPWPPCRWKRRNGTNGRKKPSATIDQGSG